MKSNYIERKARFSGRKKFYQLVTLIFVMAMTVCLSACNDKEAMKNSDYAFYLENNEIQYADLENMDAIESKQLTEKLLESKDGDIYSVSDDIDLILKNQAVLFPDHSNEQETRLYYKFLNKENEKPQFIDENIKTYLLSEDKENLLYVQGDNFSLYQWSFDSKKKEKLTEYVGEYHFSKDGKEICYLDEHADLYVKSQNKEPQKLAENILYIYYFNEDLTKFLYGKDEDMYLYQAGKEEKIAEGVVPLGFFENGEGYYLTDKKMISWEELIEDDVPSDSPKKEYVKALFEEGAYEYGWTLNTLWYFDGEKSHKLSDRYLWYLQSIMPDVAMSSWLMKDRTQLFYREYDAKAFEKIKLSELKEENEVDGKIFDEFQKSAPFFVAIKDKMMTIPGVVAENVSTDASGRHLYFYKNPDADFLKGDLYRIEVSEDGVSEPEFVSDNVLLSRENVLSDGTEIYFKFRDEFVGDLYIDGKKVEENVEAYTWQYDEKTKTLLYLANWNRKGEYGDLKSYVNGESKFIANDVFDAYFTESGKILYMTDRQTGNEGKNSLFVYNGEKSQQITQNMQRLYFIGDERRDPM
ncbi:MAG: hypothetical protein Q4D65_04920 [Peptostreptococcaceae bacterium]|nr:hypothetical protein [Peptostreptococcaceae bacterium]